jgi:hypothetical protein
MQISERVWTLRYKWISCRCPQIRTNHPSHMWISRSQVLVCCVNHKCGYTLVTLPRIVTPYLDSVGRDSWPRNISKFGYAVTLRARSVCCRYLAVASKGWYGYGRSRCGRATWHVAPNFDSTPIEPVTLPRNQLLIRYAVTSLVHTVTIRCYDTR